MISAFILYLPHWISKQNDFNNSLTYSNWYCKKIRIGTAKIFLWWWLVILHKKMKFSIKDFFSKCDQICSFLRIWSYLLKKSGKPHFFVECNISIVDDSFACLFINIILYGLFQVLFFVVMSSVGTAQKTVLQQRFLQ